MKAAFWTQFQAHFEALPEEELDSMLANVQAQIDYIMDVEE